MLLPLVIACGLGAPPPPETPVASEVRSMNQEAYRAFREQEFGRARELAEQTRERVRARDDPRAAGFAAANLAAALAITGRVDEALLARLPGALQHRQVQPTLMLDAYHLLRLRHVTMPLPLIDFFPWFFDQLALEPAEGEDEDR